MQNNNPFQITTPESLTANQAHSLFVDVFTDFPKITHTGHVFLTGPRGAGKSMMFRYLRPDCQRLEHNCDFKDLPFLGIYIPLKNTNFSLAELQRLEHKHASDILNEHIMVMYFCARIFDTLSDPHLYQNKIANLPEIQAFYNDFFLSFLPQDIPDLDYSLPKDLSTTPEIFRKMLQIVEFFYAQAISYAKKLAFRTDFMPYDGPLYDYLGFLYPILKKITTLPGFPAKPIYLLVDDAHWLKATQAKVLNSWVATRTSGDISLKISTQYNYESYYTITGATIDTPHDFTEIDITTIYTGTNKKKYRDRLETIIKKRLELFGIKDISAQEFFPEDKQQEEEIRKIEEYYKKRHDEGKGKGNQRSDDSSRYARPDFIKNLAGTRKASSTYNYAGFSQLVHLSSGIIRHFLQPAYNMYATALSRTKDFPITKISPSIQNEIVREDAEHFLFSDLEKLQKEGHENAPPEEDIKKLSNLINGLGGLFRKILLSNRAERRIFSIAFSDSPSQEVERILSLGYQLGYFHKSTIGRKESQTGGRTRLYILNKRLAPIWTLDPTSFAGYLFMPNRLMEEALCNPLAMLKRIGKSELDNLQLELFDNNED